MIFTPDPLTRARRELRLAQNQAIDAEIQKQHAFSASKFANAKVAFLRNIIQKLESENEHPDS